MADRIDQNTLLSESNLRRSTIQIRTNTNLWLHLFSYEFTRTTNIEIQISFIENINFVFVTIEYMNVLFQLRRKI